MKKTFAILATIAAIGTAAVATPAEAHWRRGGFGPAPAPVREAPGQPGRRSRPRASVKQSLPHAARRSGRRPGLQTLLTRTWGPRSGWTARAWTLRSSGSHPFRVSSVRLPAQNSSAGRRPPSDSRGAAARRCASPARRPGRTCVKAAWTFQGATERGVGLDRWMTLERSTLGRGTSKSRS